MNRHDAIRQLVDNFELLIEKKLSERLYNKKEMYASETLEKKEIKKLKDEMVDSYINEI